MVEKKCFSCWHAKHCCKIVQFDDSGWKLRELSFSAKTVCENLKNIASWVLLIIWAETPRYSFTLSSAGITRKKSFAELSIRKLIISLNFSFFLEFWCFFVPNTSSVLLVSALAYQAEVGFLSRTRYFEKDLIRLIYKSFLDNVPTLVFKQGRVENQNLAYRVGVLVENRSLKVNSFDQPVFQVQKK